jgi:hypothetical protein
MTFKEFKALNPYHGMPVRCVIDGIEITDAKLSKNEHGEWFVSQNIRNGTSRGDKLGYLYNFCIFWGNKGDDEEIERGVTSLTPLTMHPFAGIKAGDLLIDKDKNFRRALSDVMYPQLGELATVIVSNSDKDKKSFWLKKYWCICTLYELQKYNYSIYKEEKPAEKPKTVEVTLVIEGGQVRIKE